MSASHKLTRTNSDAVILSGAHRAKSKNPDTARSYNEPQTLLNHKRLFPTC